MSADTLLARLCLDTNIVISGVIGNQASPPVLILNAVLDGLFDVVVNEPLLEEYRRTFRKPKLAHLAQDRIGDVLSFFEYRAERVASSMRRYDLPDPNDNHVLDCAVMGRADCLITGNKRDFPMERFEGVRIVTAREFLLISALT